MKRLFLIFAVMCGAAQVQAQMVVTVCPLKFREAMNHVEQMQQAVQTYQTMMAGSRHRKLSMPLEKGQQQLATVREAGDCHPPGGLRQK